MALYAQVVRRGCFVVLTLLPEVLQYEAQIISEKVRAPIAIGCGDSPAAALEFAYGKLLERETVFCPSCGQ
jgi:hypothetical protein